METPLAEGVWVRVVLDSHFLNGIIGFIAAVDDEDKEYIVRFTKDRFGKTIKTRVSRLCDYDVVVPVPLELEPDDLSSMIDLAIDTNDEEWFLELTSRLPKELPW